MRISGPQVYRAIEAGGGLWTQGEAAKAIGWSSHHIIGQWESGARSPRYGTWPPPVAKSGGSRLYAGEDILTFLEASGRFAAAERFAEAMRLRRKQSRYEGEKWMTQDGASQPRKPDSSTGG